MIEFEFLGIPSGDNSSFCWDVDKETFKSIIGREPKETDRSCFNKGLYRVYPDNLYPDSRNCKTKIQIEYDENYTPSAFLVKLLVDLTGASMRDCKKALILFKGNINQAKEFITLKGAAVNRCKSGKPWTDEDYVDYIKKNTK